MSFFAKGDFKLQDSWDCKPGNENRASSRSSSRREADPDSLMMQLAGSYAEPTPDIIDDSLSRLLMKERGGIPTPGQRDPNLKKLPQKLPHPPGPPSKAKKIEEDKDLLSSMAGRLQKLEKTTHSQRLELKVEKIKHRSKKSKWIKLKPKTLFSRP